MSFPLWYNINQTSYTDSLTYSMNSPDIIIFNNKSDDQFDEYCITSHHLFSCRDNQELNARALSLQLLFDGAQILLSFNPDDIPIKWGNLHKNINRKVTSKKEPSHENIPLHSPFCESKIKKSKKDEILSLNDDLSKLLFLSRYDELVRDVLIYTGYNRSSYITFYAYKDWLTGEKWTDDKIIEKAQWSKKEYKKFTHTVNSHTILGPRSRHGGPSNRLPRDFEAMPLREARKHMKKAMIALINERLDVFIKGLVNNTSSSNCRIALGDV